MGLSVLQVAYALAPPVSADAVGGAEQVMAMLDEGLAAGGHDVALVAAPGSVTSGRLFPAPPPPRHIDGPARFHALEAQAAALRAALAAARPDVVHLHGIDFDRVLPPSGPPALATLHLAPSAYAPGALRDGRAALVCVSEAQARALPPGVRLADVVPNGVPLDVFRPGGPKAGFALVLARVCRDKGVAEALRAARRAGVPLLVGGQVFPYPEHRRYFDEDVRPLLDGPRRFLGPVGRAEKRGLLAAARCLVAPSRVPETSSVVAMEALASGTPVVAYRAGALPEIVDDGVTGFLVRTESELADAIREAARLDPGACRRAAEARFGARRMIEGYARAYRRLAARPAPGRRRAPPAVEEVRGLGALEALAPAWSALADTAPAATPFQRPEWLLPWCRAAGVAEPRAIAVRRGGELAALAPYLVYDAGGRRVATLLGAGVSDWQDALLAPGADGAEVAEIVRRLAASADAVLLERLPGASPLVTAGAGAGAVPDDPCPALALPATFDALAGSASPRLLEGVRYGRRRLAREGGLRFTEAGADDLERHLDALFALHAARWAARGERGVLAAAAIRRLHREAARGFAARGALRLHVAWCGDRPAAAWYGFRERDRVSYYLGGFDPSLRAASPGAVAVAHAIARAIDEGARELDFLRGRERYKYEWGARDRPAWRRTLPGAGPGSRVAAR